MSDTAEVEVVPDDDDARIFERVRAAKKAFSPSRPVATRDLFEGRSAQIFRLEDVVDEPGQHAVIYGERGVGKTSLAHVASQFLTLPNMLTVRTNCSSQDTFASIWRRTLNEIAFTQSGATLGFVQVPTQTAHRGGELLPAPGVDVTPDDVRIAIRTLSAMGHLLLFLDEFDRIEDKSVRDQFADLLKTLSDHAVDATVVLVGVADNVDELIAEHQSVERAIAQVDMPRMENSELAAIVTKGLKQLGMTAPDEVIAMITTLSQGLPHYTHLLAQEAAIAACYGRHDQVSEEDLRLAIQQSLTKAQESVSEMYYRATRSNRDNLYTEVLLACALAERDERGFFTAAAVRTPLSTLTGRTIDIPQFAAHLKAFCSDRGPVLRQEGTVKKFRYRFLNPLMSPHVIMRGLDEGRLKPEMVHSSAGPIARGR